ncbi:hypothetical protein Lmac_3028 [Legionella maceachernii]|uniref:Uncharacterized protein n=1 Tax=Legionella maceachernii TaxID=466 RepID=A0A0W0VVJ3_9GAMM|nr:hypothetical protein [Legionella maceachernii]KTD24155.1 hypothetical protein Lmac_3028 [Legionella maceachernii]SJZ87550.1 hypothetical protein SAMN02745128_01324 [Legionella maceachernii]SUO98928.1 Uncharacterised protein [Legionella maceachernii]
MKIQLIIAIIRIARFAEGLREFLNIEQGKSITQNGESRIILDAYKLHITFSGG